MEIELSRQTIKLPRLADTDDAPLPQPLVTAHTALTNLTATATAKIAAIRSDQRISESERADQLRAVADTFATETGKLTEITSTCASLSAEVERSALHKRVSQYDPARLAAIVAAVAPRPKAARLAAVMRAANGDAESACALLTSPRELGVLSDLDERIVALLRGALVPSEVIEATRASEVGVARMRVGLQYATAKVRELCGVQAPMAERIVRGG